MGQPLRLSEVAALLGGHLRPGADPQVTGAASLADAGPGDLSFVTGADRLGEAQRSTAGAFLVPPGLALDRPAIEVDRPYEAFARFLARLLPDPDRLYPPGVHPTAVVHPTASVGAASVGPYCVIGAGAEVGSGCRLGPHVTVGCDARLGRDCVLHAHVTVREGCRLGERVIVHAGTVIGADGFGYLPGPRGQLKIPQVGIVEVGDDVELGALVTIDRATTGRTIIGAGSKLDNQVHVAHNVHIGRSCALSAQTGIAGSCVLGDGVITGGQVGIADHLTIGDGARIGAQAGVIKDVPKGATVFGYPALDFQESFRITAAMRRLPAALGRLRSLEHRLTGSPAPGAGQDARNDQNDQPNREK
ncbi:MAG: UDP-3-O-(3-hydroxymyristoyl)glucosamine N-acyltransferase [bacterium]|nr:UDP-3-O-(3-hydroxymyristoyl)glucosamine N-acyltransferase [bacterium]